MGHGAKVWEGICVTEGDQVKKGQVLFMIDSRSARLDLESAQANLQAAIAQESLLSAQLNEASNMYNGAQAIIALYIALGGGTR